MNPVISYIKLTQEFKHKLGRDLTKKESDFIKWMVHQELEKQRKSWEKYPS